MMDSRYQELELTIKVLAEKVLTHRTQVLGPQLAEELDSVERLTLIVAIEDHFGIAFDPVQDKAIHTLHDLILALEENLSDGSSSDHTKQP